jgi:hypothetical protein
MPIQSTLQPTFSGDGPASATPGRLDAPPANGTAHCDLSGATHGQIGQSVSEAQHRMDVCVVRVKATPASAFELLQVALELVDGLLF